MEAGKNMPSALFSMAVRLPGNRLLADPSILRGLSAIGRGCTMVGFLIFPKIESEFPHAFPGGCRPPFFRYRVQNFFGRELVLLGKEFQS